MDRSPSVSGGLAWLLSPISVSEFTDRYRSRAPLHIVRDDTSYFQEIPSKQDIDGLIVSTIVDTKPKHGRLVRTEPDGGFSERAFRLTSEGRVDLQNLYSSYVDGYSVVLNLVEQRSPIVASICRALANELGGWVGANYYLTPAGAQGFGAHYDSHDVLIVQLSGSKSWRVGRAPYSDVEGEGVAREEFADEAQIWELAAGDVMYLPKGTPHQGVTGSASSLHVTFGIEPWPNLSELQPELRTTYLSRFMARTGHFASLDALSTLTGHSVITRGITGPMLLRESPSGIVLEFPDGAIEFPITLRTALEYVIGTEEFRINDVAMLNSYEARISLISKLIREGALAIADQ